MKVVVSTSQNVRLRFGFKFFPLTFPSSAPHQAVFVPELVVSDERRVLEDTDKTCHAANQVLGQIISSTLSFHLEYLMRFVFV